MVSFICTTIVAAGEQNTLFESAYSMPDDAILILLGAKNKDGHFVGEWIKPGDRYEGNDFLDYDGKRHIALLQTAQGVLELTLEKEKIPYALLPPFTRAQGNQMLASIIAITRTRASKGPFNRPYDPAFEKSLNSKARSAIDQSREKERASGRILLVAKSFHGYSIHIFDIASMYKGLPCFVTANLTEQDKNNFSNALAIARLELALSNMDPEAPDPRAKGIAKTLVAPNSP
jgi:hypothetical protein